jgi:2-keto-3-deoxy-L-rhamnonate aldolase RhmA
MRTHRIRAGIAASGALLLAVAAGLDGQAPAPSPRLYNTVKQKLAEGKQVVGGTIQLPDPDLYCAVANAGFDFTWIEMQHSPLTYQDVARMIMACKGAPAIPFIRVPDATEGDVQKATDIGALGIILPMVDTVEKAAAAVKFARYPPAGRRSQGAGQHNALWGSTYRETANDNLTIVAMIENPAGVDIVDQIAAVPGVDVVFVASTDLSSFSGMKQNEPKYEALVTKVLQTTTKAGLKVGGPLAWKNSRKGYTFFQGPSEAVLIRCGTRVSLGLQPSNCPTGGVASTEGAEK